MRDKVELQKKREREELSYFSYAYFPFIGIWTSHLRRCLNFLARPLLLSFWWTVLRLDRVEKREKQFLPYLSYNIALNHFYTRIFS